MKKQQLLILLTFMLMICSGCKKDSESPALAANAIGLYSGYWNVYGGSYAGICELTRVTAPL